METTLYLIEDDLTVHEFLRTSLLSRPLWELLGQSATYVHAREHAANAQAGVYLVDLGLPDGRGEDLLRQLSKSNPEAELLVFTVFGDESRLVQAIEAGATGYVLKGCTSHELLEAIEQIQDGGAPISALLARMLLKRFRSDVAPPKDGFSQAIVTAADRNNTAAGLSAIGSKTIHPESADAASHGLQNVILSEREQDVLTLVAQGYVNKEIARKLEISSHTVGTHIKSLYRKLAAHSRVQVVRIAQERGLV